jgi:hypothetical protein
MPVWTAAISENPSTLQHEKFVMRPFPFVLIPALVSMALAFLLIPPARFPISSELPA